MRSLGKRLLCILLLLLTNNLCFASGKPTLRRILNNIHVDIGGGHGLSFYQNKVQKMEVLKREDRFFLINPAEPEVAYIINWFKDPNTTVENFSDSGIGGVRSNPQEEVVFKGTGRTTPITLSLYTEIKKRFRLGGGIGVSVNTISTLRPNAEQEKLGNYNTSQQTTYYKSYFGMMGFKIINKPAYAILADVRMGEHFSFSKLPNKKFTGRRIFYNAGITVEKNISEYFRLFWRTSYEYQYFTDEITKGRTILFERSDVYLQFGISLNWPELPRCKIRNCKIEIKHNHRGKSYRGVSMLKGKDVMGNLIHERQP
ncbi:MAG: hypothetical protein MI674_05100 [Cytophagales bacterium]|nr:hypothetical protein [Cytophagales bacterium]